MEYTSRAFVLLLAAAPALASSYDPYQDRAALRKAASSAYDAAVRAAGMPLAPERVADIKASLDESLAQAVLASNTAKGMETEASRRGDEMAGALRGRGAAAPVSAAKDLADGAVAARARWRSLSQDHADLSGRVSAGSDLAAELARAAASLAAADAALGQVEAAAPAAQSAAAQMTEAEARARRSAEERAAADAEISRSADALPAAIADAKSAVDQLGQEPQGANKTRASQKLSAPADLANQLYSAADRACNRADDYRARSVSFDRAQAADDSAQSAGAAAAAKAKAALDDADKAQADVRSRLGR